MNTSAPEEELPSRSASVKDYTLVLLALVLLTLFNRLLAPVIGYWSVALLYLLGVTGMACVLSQGTALLFAALSVIAWNIFFIPPVYHLGVRSLPDLLMCLTYLIVALIIAGLTSRIRAQEARVRLREHRLGLLYRFSHRLVETGGREALIKLAEEEVSRALNLQVRISADPPSAAFSTSASIESELNESELNQSWRVPLQTANQHYGVMILSGSHPPDSGQLRLLETLCRQLALALERESLQESATQTRLNSFSETLYDALFDSVSHELKTPLTALQCSIDNLRQPQLFTQEELRLSLLTDLEDASRRLNHVIANLLDMSRLESGRLILNQSWCDPGDILRAALKALEAELAGYPLRLTIPEQLPLIYVDFALLEQALLNLIHNACTHNPPGITIEISLSATESELQIQICDQGSGLKVNNPAQLFDKFYRPPGTQSSGTGLGLSITKGFIEVHHGQLNAFNRPEGGACFTVRLPVQELPALPLEEEDVTTYSDY